MRIKICGITNVNDALAAADAGADAIGLNFVSGPRKIDIMTAAEIIRQLPAFVTPVALVRLQSGALDSEFCKWLNDCPITHLQIYGAVDENNIALNSERFRLIPVVAVKSESFADDLPAIEPFAVVLDTFDPNRAGGTGASFLWEWVAKARRGGQLTGWPPIILAGGLRPDNVADAVRIVQPYAVDVSSGVELEDTPGKKDIRKMREFVLNAKSAM